MSPLPLTVLILLVMVVIATASFAIHEIFLNALPHSPKKKRRRDKKHHRQLSQIPKIKLSLTGTEMQTFSILPKGQVISIKSRGLTVAMQNQKFPLKCVFKC